MSIKPTKRIALRYSAADEERIAKVLAITKENTANKAILKMIRVYPEALKRTAELKRENEALREKLGPTSG